MDCYKHIDRYGSSYLGISVMGTYRKTKYCRSRIWRSSRSSSNYSSFRFCWSNGGNYYRHFSRYNLLWLYCLQERKNLDALGFLHVALALLLGCTGDAHWWCMELTP